MRDIDAKENAGIKNAGGDEGEMVGGEKWCQEMAGLHPKTETLKIGDTFH